MPMCKEMLEVRQITIYTYGADEGVEKYLTNDTLLPNHSKISVYEYQ
jgi:hypothetical protein